MAETVSGASMAGLDAESRQLVVDTIRQLRKRLMTKTQILAFDRQEQFPEATIRELLGPDIGLQLLFIPEAYGGMGGGARDCVAVTREMAKICLGVATAFFAIQLGADPLIVGGTEDQKEKWLGAIAQGNTLVAYAVTEAGAGSNLAALTTKAEPMTNEAGRVTGYRLNGAKQFISTGGYADFVTLLAKAPEGPTFFVVQRGTPGFNPGKGEEKHGIRASNTSPITLTDAVVPVENLIGANPGQGLKQANQVFGYTRVMVAAMALGAAESAMAIAVAYAKERIQFGTPLSEKQGYTHKLIVPHTVRMAAAESYIDEVAYRLDAGESDLQVEGSIAKFFTTEAANRAADDAMQALGGYGYICEFEVEKIKRDVKITCIYEGTSEIQQNIIATFRWKVSRKTKGQFYGAIATDLQQIEIEMPDAGAATCAAAARILNQVIDHAHETRKTRLQHMMFCLSEMMTHVEVGTSLVRKACRLAAASDPAAEKMRLMAKIFSAEVAEIVARNALHIIGGDGRDETFNAFLETTDYRQLLNSQRHLVDAMDRAADMIFER